MSIAKSRKIKVAPKKKIVGRSVSAAKKKPVAAGKKRVPPIVIKQYFQKGSSGTHKKRVSGVAHPTKASPKPRKTRNPPKTRVRTKTIVKYRTVYKDRDAPAGRREMPTIQRQTTESIARAYNQYRQPPPQNARIIQQQPANVRVHPRSNVSLLNHAQNLMRKGTAAVAVGTAAYGAAKYGTNFLQRYHILPKKMASGNDIRKLYHAIEDAGTKYELADVQSMIKKILGEERYPDSRTKKQLYELLQFIDERAARIDTLKKRSSENNSVEERLRKSRNRREPVPVNDRSWLGKLFGQKLPNRPFAIPQKAIVTAKKSATMETQTGNETPKSEKTSNKSSSSTSTPNGKLKNGKPQNNTTTSSNNPNQTKNQNETNKEMLKIIQEEKRNEKLKLEKIKFILEHQNILKLSNHSIIIGKNNQGKNIKEDVKGKYNERVLNGMNLSTLITISNQILSEQSKKFKNSFVNTKQSLTTPVKANGKSGSINRSNSTNQPPADSPNERRNFYKLIHNNTTLTEANRSKLENMFSNNITTPITAIKKEYNILKGKNTHPQSKKKKTQIFNGNTSNVVNTSSFWKRAEAEAEAKEIERKKKYGKTNNAVNASSFWRRAEAEADAKEVERKIQNRNEVIAKKSTQLAEASETLRKMEKNSSVSAEELAEAKKELAKMKETVAKQSTGHTQKVLKYREILRRMLKDKSATAEELAKAKKEFAILKGNRNYQASQLETHKGISGEKNTQLEKQLEEIKRLRAVSTANRAHTEFLKAEVAAKNEEAKKKILNELQAYKSNSKQKIRGLLLKNVNADPGKYNANIDSKTSKENIKKFVKSIQSEIMTKQQEAISAKHRQELEAISAKHASNKVESNKQHVANIEAAEQKIAAASGALNAKITEHQRYMNKIQQTIGGLQGTLEKLQSNKAGLETTLAAKQTEFNAVTNNRNATASKKLEAEQGLADARAELKGVQQSLSNTQKQLTNHQIQVKERNAALNVQKTTIEKLTGNVEGIKGKLAQAVSTGMAKSETFAKLERELQKKLINLEKLSSNTLQSTRNEHDRVLTALETATNTKIGEQKQLIDTMKGQIEDLTTQHVAAQAEIRQKGEELVAKQQLLQQELAQGLASASEIASLRANIEQKTLNLNQAQQRSAKLNTNLSNTQGKLTTTSNQLTQAQTNLQQRQANLNKERAAAAQQQVIHTAAIQTTLKEKANRNAANASAAQQIKALKSNIDKMLKAFNITNVRFPSNTNTSSYITDLEDMKRRVAAKINALISNALTKIPTNQNQNQNNLRTAIQSAQSIGDVHRLLSNSQVRTRSRLLNERKRIINDARAHINTLSGILKKQSVNVLLERLNVVEKKNKNNYSNNSDISDILNGAVEELKSYINNMRQTYHIDDYPVEEYTTIQELKPIASLFVDFDNSYKQYKKEIENEFKKEINRNTLFRVLDKKGLKTIETIQNNIGSLRNSKKNAIQKMLTDANINNEQKTNLQKRLTNAKNAGTMNIIQTNIGNAIENAISKQSDPKELKKRLLELYTRLGQPKNPEEDWNTFTVERLQSEIKLREDELRERIKQFNTLHTSVSLKTKQYDNLTYDPFNFKRISPDLTTYLEKVYKIPSTGIPYILSKDLLSTLGDIDYNIDKDIKKLGDALALISHSTLKEPYTTRGTSKTKWDEGYTAVKSCANFLSLIAAKYLSTDKKITIYIREKLKTDQTIGTLNARFYKKVSYSHE